ncbi:hypothetical protein [Antrihabitans sp. YC2-6]|uniref:hypothetical protein n=1 Tax=Antrihabitans sp. YC2-6 TaxID=2799498 RepID=UPI0027DB49F8|nr:hypothetical protein [Antrihabitans sp. YC2-6]
MIPTGPKSILFKTMVASAAAVVALGISACGSDDDSSSDATTTSAAAAATTTTTSAAAAAGPSAEELQAPLVALADLTKPAADRAVLLVNGEARIPNIDTMTAALQSYGQITFAVRDITTAGTTANATTDVTTVHGTAPMPFTWENVDGTWKLSDASTCQLLALGQAPCA